jgi:hypothetical protein
MPLFQDDKLYRTCDIEGPGLLVPSTPTPLLVPVVEARRLLGGIGHNQFWKLAKAGELELVGSERKRWVVVASITAYVARMPRRQSKTAPAGEVRA